MRINCENSFNILSSRFDVGSVLAQERIEIQPDETYIELYEKLARIGANALIDTIAKLPDVLNTAKSQDEEKATYGECILKLELLNTFMKYFKSSIFTIDIMF